MDTQTSFTYVLTLADIFDALVPENSSKEQVQDIVTWAKKYLPKGFTKFVPISYLKSFLGVSKDEWACIVRENMDRIFLFKDKVYIGVHFV